MVTVAFDVGGVLSKQPRVWHPVVAALADYPGVRVIILTDQQPREKVLALLANNGYGFIKADNVFCADYKTHGENCKALLCRELKVDVLVDDHMAYLCAVNAPPVRLFVMPDPWRPYLHQDWCQEGVSGPDRVYPAGAKKPPEDRRGAAGE